MGVRVKAGVRRYGAETDRTSRQSFPKKQECGQLKLVNTGIFQVLSSIFCKLVGVISNEFHMTLYLKAQITLYFVKINKMQHIIFTQILDSNADSNQRLCRVRTIIHMCSSCPSCLSLLVQVSCFPRWMTPPTPKLWEKQGCWALFLSLAWRFRFFPSRSHSAF